MKLSTLSQVWLVLGSVGVYAVGCGAGEEATWENEDAAQLAAAVSAPNDPDFKTMQWHLNNTGQGVYLKDDPVVGTKGVDLRILKAWDKTVGSSSVVVGVIEPSDMDLAHPDLAGAFWVNSGEVAGNGVDDDHNGYVDDRNGFDFVDQDGFDDPGDHGTHIAGTIAARKGNSLGGSGVAPGVKIMALRATAKNNTVIEAIDYAKSRGVKIINLSQGGLDYYNDAVRAKLAAETGMLFICSAGNFASAHARRRHHAPSEHRHAIEPPGSLGQGPRHRRRRGGPQRRAQRQPASNVDSRQDHPDLERGRRRDSLPGRA
jgi:hypothetical protein